MAHEGHRPIFLSRAKSTVTKVSDVSLFQKLFEQCLDEFDYILTSIHFFAPTCILFRESKSKEILLSIYFCQVSAANLKFHPLFKLEPTGKFK